MSTINVSQAHGTTADDAIQKIQPFVSGLGRYGVKATWSGRNATVKGMGVSGGLAVTDTAVNVSITLGMMAKAAGVNPQRLKARIERDLNSALTGETA